MNDQQELGFEQEALPGTADRSLTPTEWQELEDELGQLFSVGWAYGSLAGRFHKEEYDRQRPTGTKATPERLAKWEAESADIYRTYAGRAHADSCDRVVRVTALVTRLKALHGCEAEDGAKTE